MGNDSLSLAKYIINDCYNKGKYINNLKLQKILYIIQGECLSKIGIHAFNDEIYAWKCGVIIHRVYFQFASYVCEPILTRYKDYERDFFLKETVDEVIARNIDKSHIQLIKETQGQGTIWEKYYNENEKYILIPKEEIKKYFYKNWSDNHA